MADGLDFSRLDGSTKSKERLQIVKDFNSSSHINLCLVSTMLVGNTKNLMHLVKQQNIYFIFLKLCLIK